MECRSWARYFRYPSPATCSHHVVWLGTYEGEQIGDEVVCLQLLSKALSSSQIGVVLALYGWELDALPLVPNGADVDVY